ncbi:MAG: 2-(1,2-epoxy-1,2-dihydrophenyl)acetyl-CoA isomerase, partial [Frankia sp.]|nr:2-(1,2-epoxy-1,2-dihydrophenyl)acetyl-CoA isomerase [Frankia sp.]
LAKGPTRGFGLTKRVLNASATSTLDDALALEAKLQAEAGRTDDHIAAARAFLAKEEPTFTGR